MDAKEIINKLGGSTVVSRVCNVKPNAVSNWKKRGIPPRIILQYPQLFMSYLFKEQVGQKEGR